MLRVWIWWTLHRLAWWFRPLPAGMQERDRLLADRAARIINRHWRALRAPASYDPYSTAPLTATSSTDAKLVFYARARAMEVLQRHSLPGHLLNALLREKDPAGLEQAKKAEAQIAAEKAHEKRTQVIEGELVDEPPTTTKAPPKLPPTTSGTP